MPKHFFFVKGTTGWRRDVVEQLLHYIYTCALDHPRRTVFAANLFVQGCFTASSVLDAQGEGPIIKMANATMLCSSNVNQAPPSPTTLSNAVFDFDQYIKTATDAYASGVS